MRSRGMAFASERPSVRTPQRAGRGHENACHASRTGPRWAKTAIGDRKCAAGTSENARRGTKNVSGAAKDVTRIGGEPTVRPLFDTHNAKCVTRNAKCVTRNAKCVTRNTKCGSRNPKCVSRTDEDVIHPSPVATGPR